jgi:hypothetical protein
MAKRKSRNGGPSKSALIREYIAAHRGEGPQEVAAALNAAHSMSITPQFVSTVKSNAKRKKKKSGRKPGRPAGETAASTANGKLSMEVLMAAKKFAEQLGGVGKAKAAVDTLAKLLG